MAGFKSGVPTAR